MYPFREHFQGPTRTAAVFTLVKGRRTATCEVWTHEMGFELRLEVTGDDLPRTQVCHRQEDLIATQATWREQLEAAGWVDAP